MEQVPPLLECNNKVIKNVIRCSSYWEDRGRDDVHHYTIYTRRRSGRVTKTCRAC